MLQPYEKNRAGAVEKTIDADPVAGAVCDLVKEQDWEGTATAMLQDLAALVPEGVSRSRLWPSANTLRDRLRRHKASLASMGILIDLEQRAATKDRSRIIVVRMPERQAS